jgi:cytochrome b involved in lipid metabolism
MSKRSLLISSFLVFVFSGAIATSIMLFNNYHGTSIKENNVVMQEITINELSTHKTKNDCWVLLDSKVFNVSDLLATSSEPNYEDSCGKDGTKAILNDSPSKTAAKILHQLNSYYIGVIVPN